MPSALPLPLQKGQSVSGLIQLAGIHDLPEAQLCIDEGVHCLGFPLRLPVNKEDITEADAAKLAHTLRQQATSVCITYLDNADDIARFCQQLGMHHVQLHGEISLEELKKLHQQHPHLYVIKSLVVRNTPNSNTRKATLYASSNNNGKNTTDENTRNHADRMDRGNSGHNGHDCFNGLSGHNLAELTQRVSHMAPYVDAFITDTHDPQTGADGATGKTHDWQISRTLVELSPKPVILAGGLNHTNVAEAIRAVRPAGVDAHTGVEGSDGRKSKELVCRFVQEAASAFASL